MLLLQALAGPQKAALFSFAGVGAMFNMSIKNIFGYWYTILFFTIAFGGWSGMLDSFSYQGPFGRAPLHVKITLPIFLLSFFGFFALMLGDFFSHKNVKRPVLVGFSLLFFNWIAILLYFWLVVYKRKKT